MVNCTAGRIWEVFFLFFDRKKTALKIMASYDKFIYLFFLGGKAWLGVNWSLFLCRSYV